MSNKKPLPISVNARLWYDGQNTYHSVEVMFSDGKSTVAPFTYGYGSHWEHTAGLLILAKNPDADGETGDVQQRAYYVMRKLRESGHVFAYDIVDVKRRKDLHNRGRD